MKAAVEELIKYRMAAQITEDLEREAAEAQQETARIKEEIKRTL